MKMKWYLVTATLKFPVYCGSHHDTGAEFTIPAQNAKEAISRARRQVRIECLYDRHSGPLTYAAKETTPPYSEYDYDDDKPREPLVFLPHPLETDYPL